jgi:pimeloyl-ACP methyl ester carboxylesterase
MEPIAIAEHSYLWIGVERVTQPDGTTATAGEHMYVEYFVPAGERRPYPVVLVHGGAGQGMAFLGRGGGEPGWAHHLLREGYAVYLLDRPGLGRNPPLPTPDGAPPPPVPYEAVVNEFRFGAQHGRWPGSGDIGDPLVDQFMAQQRPSRFDIPQPYEIYRRRGAELLDQIGPAILVMHSAGGPFGWLTADARPDLTKAVVSVEGLPPAMLTVPLEYDPPIASTDELAFEPVPDPGDIEWGPLERLPRVVQAQPPRKLAHLSQMPIACVISDDPRFGQMTRAESLFLKQAGCDVTDLVLSEHGITGNGHFMTLEDNSREVLGVILEWLRQRVE